VVNDRFVALTFDDGPFEPYTSTILDVLDRYRIKATFFLVGKHCDRMPAVAREIVLRGHAVGNHSHCHSVFTVFDFACRDVEWGLRSIENASGVRPRLYRPPYGILAPWQKRAVERMGMTVVRWTLDSADYLFRDHVKLARRVVEKATPGSIVLLHDGRATGSGADRAVTVKALPLIIDGLQARGFRFVTPSAIESTRRMYR